MILFMCYLIFIHPQKLENVAKSRTEVLNSIKTKLESFKNNPLLNPDFSETVIPQADKSHMTFSDVTDEIMQEINEILETMSEHTGIRELVEFNDRLEKELFDAIEAQYSDSAELPDHLFLETGLDTDELPSSDPLEES